MDEALPWVLGLAAGGGLLYTIFALAARSGQPVCPACAARGTLRWRHLTRKGRPDMRYADNRQTCGACGWSTNQPIRGVPDSPTAPTPIPVWSENRTAAVDLAARRERLHALVLGLAASELREEASRAKRRKILIERMGQLDDAGKRDELRLIAGRIETLHAVNKAATLRTPAARVRNLSQMLTELQTDEADDAQQAAEMGLLEAAVQAAGRDETWVPFLREFRAAVDTGKPDREGDGDDPAPIP